MDSLIQEVGFVQLATSYSADAARSMFATPVKNSTTFIQQTNIAMSKANAQSIPILVMICFLGFASNAMLLYLDASDAKLNPRALNAETIWCLIF